MNFLRIYRSSTVGRIADWTSLAQLTLTLLGLCGGSALLTWLASTVEPIMQYGWGAVVFAGLTAACSIVITLSVGAFAFRALVPSKIIRVSSPSDDQLVTTTPSAVQFDAMAAEVDALKGIAQVHYEDFDKRFSVASQRIGAILERLDKLDEILKPPAKTFGLALLGETFAPVNNRFEAIERSLSSFSASLSSIDARFESTDIKLGEKIDKIQLETNKSFQKTQAVILAERVLESYERMVGEIDLLINKMDDPLSKTEIYGSWSTWEEDFSSFKMQMSALERFLRTHAATDINLFDTPSEKYKSQHWSYNFRDLNDDQKMNYKTFRIISGNFSAVKSDIKSKLYNSTFLNL